MSEPTNVWKIGMIVPRSVEVLLDAGAITEERAREMGWTPPPPTPRLRALRWALRSWWWDHRPRVHFGPCDIGEDW